jgi:creatinine amidohydrolase
MTSVKWAEHTAPEIALAAQQNVLVILPLGCTEQHAAHLPVDTDTYQVERLTLEGARKAAELSDTFAETLHALDEQDRQLQRR